MRCYLVAAFIALVCCPAAQVQTRLIKQKDDPKEIKKPAPATPKVGGKTLQQWRTDLTSEDPSKRAIAIMAIMNFGEEARLAVPQIIKCLSDNDLSPRAKACLALRMMEIDDDDIAKVVSGLAGRLSRTFSVKANMWVWNEPQAIIRYEAAVSLRRFVKDAKPAIPALINGTLDKSSWEIRHMCAATLWRAGMDPENGPDVRAIRALLNLLKWDSTYQVRLEIVIGLGSLGPPSDQLLAKEVIDTLDAASRSKNMSYALWAFAGLVNVGDPKRGDVALSQIARFLKNEDLELRVQAAGAMGALGTRSKKRVKDLIVLLSDPEPLAASAAAMALAQIGDTSDTVRDALLSLLKDNAKESLKDNASTEEKISFFNAGNKAVAAILSLVNLKTEQPRLIAEFDKLKEKKDLNPGMKGLLEQAISALKKQEKEKPKDKPKDKIAPKDKIKK